MSYPGLKGLLSAFLDCYQHLSVFEWQTTHMYICKHTGMGEWKDERERKDEALGHQLCIACSPLMHAQLQKIFKTFQRFYGYDVCMFNRVVQISVRGMCKVQLFFLGTVERAVAECQVRTCCCSTGNSNILRHVTRTEQLVDALFHFILCSHLSKTEVMAITL